MRIKPSEITPKAVYKARRRFMGQAGRLALAGSMLGVASGMLLSPATQAARKLQARHMARFSTDEELTDHHDATHYNNFYEFGTGKKDPARNSHAFKPRPWTVTIDGEVGKPGRLDLDDFLKPHALEERIYRLRCVEAWSMVIPWIGIPLADVLKRFEPNGNAKYVAFETLYDTRRMPGQLKRTLRWPYREGLRLDEAMHPLAFLAIGMYGEELPNQNGAPIRLVVPWKYGFKSIKSIVRIQLTDRQPPTTWNQRAPGEYGFYANVNPTVDHPRWSQKKERRIGDFFKRKTLMFNGYGDQVASLYSGMDLRKYF